MNKRVNVVVSGFVQGVCFRYATRQRAESLGLKGWVKNRFDGKVEAVFEGKEKGIKEMLSWCQQGPSGAMVRNVEITEEEFSGKFKGFGIRF